MRDNQLNYKQQKLQEMKLQFMKRSLAQGGHFPSVDGGSIAMASPAGFGFAGRAATCTEVRNSNPSGVRESNRVSNWLFRMVALLAVLLTGSLVIEAVPVKFVESNPSSGKEISEFHFTLTFDIEDAVNSSDAGEWGIGYTGSTSTSARNKNRTILYEGEPGAGKEIARALTSNFTGASDNFVVGGNTVDITFSQELKPEIGKSYYLEVGNIFSIYNKGSQTWNDDAKLSFNTDPLILTFIGGESSSAELVYQYSSLSAGSDYQTIDEVGYTFNTEISLVKGGKMVIYENGIEIYSTSNLILSTDNLSVIGKFDTSVPLWKGHSYSVQLSAGSVSLASDSKVVNKEVNVPVVGGSTNLVPITGHTPANDFIGLVDKLTMTFDIPEGYTLTPPTGRTHNRKGLLYLDEIKESNLVLSIMGTVTADGNGQTFDLSSVSPLPSSKYIFVKPANEITLWKDGNEVPEYGNPETQIHWTTPSIEQLGISPINVGTVKVGQHDDKSVPEFIDGGTYAAIDRLEIMKVAYQYEGQSYKTTLNWDEKTCYVYDVTDGTRKLVKEILIGVQQREDYYEYYGVFALYPQMNFLQDHTYEIVIPSGVIRLSDNKPLYNYVTNDEIVYTIKGATPAEFKVLSCSVEDDSTMSNVPSAIVWVLNGAYDLKDGNTLARVVRSAAGSTILVPWDAPVYSYKNGSQTHVSVYLSDRMSGECGTLNNGETLKVTLPAGSIVYPGDDSLSNPELTLTINGKDEAVMEAETVNVNLAVNGLHTTSHPSVKGKPYTLTLTPEENWIVESVKHGDNVLAAKNGAYVTEPLDKDADIYATLAYDGPWAVEVSTGVWEIQDSNIQIFRENGQIIVSGATPDKTISVYTTNGMLVNTAHAVEGMDRVHISAASGQTYIVIVDGKAAKIQL